MYDCYSQIRMYFQNSWNFFTSPKPVKLIPSPDSRVPSLIRLIIRCNEEHWKSLYILDWRTSNQRYLFNFLCTYSVESRFLFARTLLQCHCIINCFGYKTFLCKFVWLIIKMIKFNCTTFCFTVDLHIIWKIV